jgi:hypothetical protein
MRIGALALGRYTIASALLIVSGSVHADDICGIFKATVYSPPDGKGAYVLANPKAVSKTKLSFPGNGVLTTNDIGHLLEIQFRSDSVCYRDCEVELVKVVRHVSPFESFGPFSRSTGNLIKAETCKSNPMDMHEPQKEKRPGSE